MSPPMVECCAPQDNLDAFHIGLDTWTVRFAFESGEVPTVRMTADTGSYDGRRNSDRLAESGSM